MGHANLLHTDCACGHNRILQEETGILGAAPGISLISDYVFLEIPHCLIDRLITYSQRVTVASSGWHLCGNWIARRQGDYGSVKIEARGLTPLGPQKRRKKGKSKK
jgi:hypothetical protein|tara:strand:- start:70 stop:387 length:318 start_codon:yes stop_codon:yes gene_type:complete